jgi:hypothetical protein
MIGGPSLFAKQVLQFQASHVWKLEVKNEGYVLNLDRLMEFLSKWLSKSASQAKLL